MKENKPKKPRRSREEVELAKIAVQERKAKRAETKRLRDEEKERKRILRETPPTQAELVHKYAKRTIQNEANRDSVRKCHSQMKNEGTENKNLWLDSSFFFSVVFQSRKQKDLFLSMMDMTDDEYSEYLKTDVRIVNGMKFAQKLGIELEEEIAQDFPQPSLDLLPFVLDNQIPEE